MKGFSLLIFMLSFSAMATSHPSCDFFLKDSVELFRISQSNKSEVLHFRLETNSNCNTAPDSKLKVYFKSDSGQCFPPSFTYIRNQLGFKNYSEMTMSIDIEKEAVYIPRLNDILRQGKSYDFIKYHLSKTRTGCDSEVSAWTRRSNKSFNHIHQEVKYIAPVEVKLYKKARQ